MRSIAIIFVDGLFQFTAQRPEAVGQQVATVIELFLDGPVSPFDPAITGGFAWWQNFERDLHILAGGLELGHEFRAADL